METIIVIGGGAAGILAAATAGSRGKKVILLEKNDKLGKKIYITGKGRCNITNMDDIEDLLDKVVTNRNFLYSALYTFSNTDLISLINDLGVPTKIERGNRVFPVSDKSSDVIKALSKYLTKNQVDIQLNSNVEAIILDNGKPVGVKVNGKTMPCDKLIIATGGVSYPATGSTGDGYKFAKSLGHTIIKPKPALIPLEVEEKWVKDLQGLALKNIHLKAFVKEKLVFEDFGEMLFTHFGISGPVPLTMSNYINSYLSRSKVRCSINLKPALDREALDKRLQKDFSKYTNKQFKNALNDLLPKKLIPVFVSLVGIAEDKYIHQITKEERNIIIEFLTDLPLTIIRTRPIAEAIITSGGVSTKEINPSTMESKFIDGLYFAGEVIDLDALTGGYNLQIAFSTGFLAGTNI